MNTNFLSNEFMENILTNSAWEALSKDFQWTESLLEKYSDKVNWDAVSDNFNMLWTPSMLEKFRRRINWTKLSSTTCTTILTQECLDKFKSYWDWKELSDNTNLVLSYELIDKFVDFWDWNNLINRRVRFNDSDNIYSLEFLERYADKIPMSKLQDSRLWDIIIDVKAEELKSEIVK